MERPQQRAGGPPQVAERGPRTPTPPRMRATSELGTVGGHLQTNHNVFENE